MLRGPFYAGFTLLATLSLAACGGARRTARIPVPNRSPSPSSSPAAVHAGEIETGIASWYGVPYHGRRSASGEIFDMEQLTAAHPTLPFQTMVEVTNLDNGKHVVVRINDRGPFVKGRIIDLSHAAAKQIEMIGPGTARVRLKVVYAPVPSG